MPTRNVNKGSSQPKDLKGLSTRATKTTAMEHPLIKDLSLKDDTDNTRSLSIVKDLNKVKETRKDIRTTLPGATLDNKAKATRKDTRTILPGATLDSSAIQLATLPSSKHRPPKEL